MSFFGFLFFCFFLLPDFSGGTQKNNHVFQLDDEETIFTVEQWAVSVSSKKKHVKTHGVVWIFHDVIYLKNQRKSCR